MARAKLRRWKVNSPILPTKIADFAKQIRRFYRINSPILPWRYLHISENIYTFVLQNRYYGNILQADSEQNQGRQELWKVLRSHRQAG